MAVALLHNDGTRDRRRITVLCCAGAGLPTVPPSLMSLTGRPPSLGDGNNAKSFVNIAAAARQTCSQATRLAGSLGTPPSYQILWGAGNKGSGRGSGVDELARGCWMGTKKRSLSS